MEAPELAGAWVGVMAAMGTSVEVALGSGVDEGGTGVEVGMAAAVWVMPPTMVAAAWV